MGDELILNVADLLQRPGSRKRVTLQDDSMALGNDLAQVEGPVGLELVLEALDEASVYVQGAITGSYLAVCRRCLAETSTRFAIPVGEVYQPVGPRDDEPGYGLVDEEIDLNALVTDGVVLQLPLHPLCRDDCRGICPVCGTNRNETECSCEVHDVDARWEALRTLLES